MRLADVFIITVFSFVVVCLVSYAINKQAEPPGYDIKVFMDGIKYGKDPRRGVCYAINPNYGYVFTAIPCEIQK